MKLLFFTGYFDDKLNANNKIAYILAENLSKCGVDVTVCGIALTDDFTKVKSDTLKIITFTGNDIVSKAKRKLELFIKTQNLPRTEAVKRFTFKHPFSAASVAYSYTKLYSNKILIRQAQKFLQKFHKNYAFDMVFAFQMPAWAVEIVMNTYLPGCKKLIYQLDPYGLHQLNSAKEAAEKIKAEVLYFDKANYVFTTSLLKEQYLKNNNYAKFQDKLIEMPFPTLHIIEEKSMENAPFSFDKAKTNIAFCGILEDVYRNPKIFLDLFSDLVLQDNNLVVYFIGDIISDTVKNYAEKLPNNIKVFSRVDNDTAFAILQNADFLLNIGNSLTNQLPSKIFEYFSLGKPIIHLCTADECACVPYVLKYPLAIILKQSDNFNQQSLKRFLCDAKGKTVLYEDVEKLYEENLPSEVCKTIVKTIEG